MAVIYSPAVTSSGLSFGFDRYSPGSWKGRPVTNLIPFPDGTYNYATNAVVLPVHNVDTTTPPVWTRTFVYGVDNPVGATGVFRVGTGTSGYKYLSIDTPSLTAGTYTWSYYARRVSGSGSLNNQQLWRDSNIGDQAVSGDWNVATYGPTWQRYATTGPVTNGATLYYFLLHSGFLTGGNTIDFAAFQMEPGTFASPWVNGSRTTTSCMFDISNNNSAITANSLTYAANNAFSFNGSSDFMTVASGQNFYSTGFTAEAVVKFTSASQTWERVFDFGSGAAVNNIVMTRAANTNDLNFFFINGSGTTLGTLTAVNAITNGTYAHFAATADGTNIKLYKNGVEIATVASAGLPSNATRTINYIGRSNWVGDSYFSGNIDSVRLYNRSLTATEINQNYRAIAARYGI
jgi:hypothetical protein